MMKNTRIIVIVGAILVVSVALDYAVTRKASSEAPTTTATTTAAISSSTPKTASSSAGPIAISTVGTSTGGYTVTVTPVHASTTAPVAPNYRTPLTFAADVPADQQASMQQQFNTVLKTLEAQPTDWSSWITLAALREQAGDYAGAVEDLTYVTEIYPHDATAFGNLGAIYSMYLMQPAKAIAVYKEAITLDPKNQVSLYENLANVYSAIGQKAEARLVLQQGIDAHVIGYQNLQQMLSSM